MWSSPLGLAQSIYHSFFHEEFIHSAAKTLVPLRYQMNVEFRNVALLFEALKKKREENQTK